MPFGVDLDIGIELYDWSYIRLSYNLPHHQDLQEKFCKAEQDCSGIYGTGLRLLSKLRIWVKNT